MKRQKSENERRHEANAISRCAPTFYIWTKMATNFGVIIVNCCVTWRNIVNLRRALNPKFHWNLQLNWYEDDVWVGKWRIIGMPTSSTRTMRSAPHFREPSGARHLLDSFGPSHRFGQGGYGQQQLALDACQKSAAPPPSQPPKLGQGNYLLFSFFVDSKENRQLE